MAQFEDRSVKSLDDMVRTIHDMSEERMYVYAIRTSGEWLLDDELSIEHNDARYDANRLRRVTEEGIKFNKSNYTPGTYWLYPDNNIRIEVVFTDLTITRLSPRPQGTNRASGFGE